MIKKKFSFFKPVLRIGLFALFLNFLIYGAVKGIQFFKKGSIIESKDTLRAIVQTGPQKEALKTSYLAELLDLSIDRPISCNRFNLKEAREKLLASPVIKEAEVTIKEPGVLYIDYTTRQPIVLLSDYENIALDQERVPFPLAPFFSPKNLPKIYLGTKKQIQWNEPLSGKKIELAFEILKLVEGPIISELFNVQCIDVSNAFQESYGKREIVLATQDEVYLSEQSQEYHYALPRLLRFSTKRYTQELSNYLKLREELLEKERLQLELSQDTTSTSTLVCPVKIIDFRLPQIAFY
jgi:hypothetical protein